MLANVLAGLARVVSLVVGDIPWWEAVDIVIIPVILDSRRQAPKLLCVLSRIFIEFIMTQRLNMGYEVPARSALGTTAK